MWVTWENSKGTLIAVQHQNIFFKESVDGRIAICGADPTDNFIILPEDFRSINDNVHLRHVVTAFENLINSATAHGHRAVPASDIIGEVANVFLGPPEQRQPITEQMLNDIYTIADQLEAETEFSSEDMIVEVERVGCKSGVIEDMNVHQAEELLLKLQQILTIPPF